jgi:hypothetical protein
VPPAGVPVSQPALGGTAEAPAGANSATAAIAAISPANWTDRLDALDRMRASLRGVPTLPPCDPGF